MLFGNIGKIVSGSHPVGFPILVVRNIFLPYDLK
jgi:hypothetical protein